MFFASEVSRWIKNRWAAWHSGSTLVSINKVTLCRTRLVLGWMTSRGKQTTSVCNQPPTPTQPCHPSMGRLMSTGDDFSHR